MNVYKIKNKIKKIKIVGNLIIRLKSNQLKKENIERNLIFKEKGGVLANTLSDLLEQHNIDYFYTYGNLLGIIREGKFIAHDNDLDIGIIENGNFLWDDLDKILSNVGLKKSHEFKLEGKVTEVTYEKEKGLSVDFFLYSSDSNGMFTYCYNRENDILYNSRYEYTPMKMYLTPLSETYVFEVAETKYRIPKNAEIYLEEVYGENWRIPNSNWIPYSSSRWIKYGEKKAIIEYFKD